MRIEAALYLAVAALAPQVACSQERTPPAQDSELPCVFFEEALEAVPHLELRVSWDGFVSEWDQSEQSGCEVAFETNDSLSAGAPIPSFDAIEGSEMYRIGWRPSHGIGADGPGSGIYGVEKEAVQCVIRWAQPAHIDDSGEIVHSETHTMKIQCRRAG